MHPIFVCLKMLPDCRILYEYHNTHDRSPSWVLWYRKMSWNQHHNIHERSLSTGHANSTADMISRLETMVLSGADLPITVVRRQIASAIDVFIHLSRLRDRSRRVTEISEVIGMKDGEVVLNPLYIFREREESGGRIIGQLEGTGNRFLRLEKLQTAGIHLEARMMEEEGKVKGGE